MDKSKTGKSKLKAFTPEQIKCAYEQTTHGGWTFYQEREFMENLLQTRFNFLITVYALFVNAFFTANARESELIIVILGLIIVFTMALTVYRIFIKVDIILKILYNLNEEEVFLVVRNELAERNRPRLFDVNPLIGYIIPIVLIASLLIGLVSTIFFPNGYKDIFKPELWMWLIDKFENYLIGYGSGVPYRNLQQYAGGKPFITGC
jgi:hypothetical protein